MVEDKEENKVEVKEAPKSKVIVINKEKREMPREKLREIPRMISPAERFPRKANSSKTSSGMGVYIFLIALSLLGLTAKNFIGYEPTVSLIISIILGVFFLASVHGTPEPKLKEILVAATLGLNLVVELGLLYILPGSGFENITITIYVSSWIILAVVLFFLGLSDALSSGEKLSKATWIILTAVLVAVLMVLYPLISTSYVFQKMSHAQYFEVAKGELTEVGAEVGKTVKGSANYWYDYFGCVSLFGTKTTLEQCLEDKRIARTCADSEDKEACIRDQKARKLGIEGFAQGAVSEIVKKVTKADLRVPEGLFPKKTSDKKDEFPIDLRIENQRELQGITGEASCIFTKANEEIPGEISITGEEKSSFKVGMEPKSFRINCRPSKELELGTYKVKYKVILHNLYTPSFLKRAVVNKDLTGEEIKQIEQDYFMSRDDRSSQAPKDLARMNFAFGNPDPERKGELNPIIKSDEVVPFVSVFENLGSSKNKIIAVNSYSSQTLLERGFRVKKGDLDCLDFYGPLEVAVKRDFVHKSCDLELPEDLKNVGKYKIITFRLDFNYDYELDDEESFVVEGAVVQ